jgi:Chalcone isomerase-like
MRAVVALMLLMWAVSANADWRDDVHSARLVGEGDFSVFGFRLYRAQLWSERVPVDYGERFALLLTYTRSIKGKRLADTGIDEIKRQAAKPIAAETLDHWRVDMLQAFSDVEPGDQLSAVFLPGKGVRFYSGEQETAEFDDPAFARAFFGIWLDPSTRAPSLRRHLLGLGEED